MKRDQEKFQAKMKELVTEKGKAVLTPITVEDKGDFSENHNLIRERVRETGRVFERGRSFDEGGGGDHWKYRKLDMLLFIGSDSDGWILRVEKYVDFYRLLESEKFGRSGGLHGGGRFEVVYL